MVQAVRYTEKFLCLGEELCGLPIHGIQKAFVEKAHRLVLDLSRVLTLCSTAVHSWVYIVLQS